MTSHRGLDIARELAIILKTLDEIIKIETDRARDMGVDPLRLVNADGEPAMTPLIIAKAQTLHALVLVNQK